MRRRAYGGLPTPTRPALDPELPEYARRAGFFVADAIDQLRAERGVEPEDLDVLVDDAAVVNGYTVGRPVEVGNDLRSPIGNDLKWRAT